MCEMTCFQQQLDEHTGWGYFHSATTPPSANSKIDDSTHKTQMESQIEIQWKLQKSTTWTMQFKHGSFRYMVEANQYVALWFEKRNVFKK